MNQGIDDGLLGGGEHDVQIDAKIARRSEDLGIRAQELDSGVVVSVGDAQGVLQEIRGQSSGLVGRRATRGQNLHKKVTNSSARINHFQGEGAGDDGAILQRRGESEEGNLPQSVSRKVDAIFRFRIGLLLETTGGYFLPSEGREGRIIGAVAAGDRHRVVGW